MKVQLGHNFNDIVSLENLLLAWEEFLPGKKSKLDVQKFAANLMDNIISLHEELVNKTYKHGGYEDFYLNDPKRRHIHKAGVGDRLVHHAVYRIIYPFFDTKFIANSFSCRRGKGVHKALESFKMLGRKDSKNYMRTCWVLKCDVKKFFANIGHEILLGILGKYIEDQNIMWLLKNIINSFHSKNNLIGLPLGNLTSQMFANVYINVFDQFIKHKLKVKKYIRYGDDFVIFSENKELLVNLLPKIQDFLFNKLDLMLHKDKIVLKTIFSGIDFLGWVHFDDHRVLRTKTKRRMFVKIEASGSHEAMQSYLGHLGHGNTYKLSKELGMLYWISK